MSTAQFDPLQLPLQGQQLIEASAGTGKTFNLAGLYLRLIIERGASVRDILVMTFTRAATQELRERIRRRLVDAARIAADRATAIAGDPEHDFVCAVLDRAVDAPAAITRRLRTAASAIDEATIVTLHGFAQRATRDNAFGSAQAFDRGDNVEDSLIFAEVGADFWRQQIYGQGGAPELLELWPTPDALMQAVRPILSRRGVVIDDHAPETLRTALQQLQAQWDADRADLLAALDDANDNNAFKQSGMKALLANHDTPQRLIQQLDARLQQAFVDNTPPILPQALTELREPSRFIAQRGKANKARSDALRNIKALPLLATLTTTARVALIADTAATIRAMADARKREHRQYSYDDLVPALHTALTRPDQGTRLAAELRRQWPYALVDEFQDTDPLQYDCLKRIYLDAPAADHDATALLLIGDPKQAIYAFRGGDIYAYLAAARAAQGAKYTLTRNYRSGQPVLDAIAALYEWPAGQPFLEHGVDFPAISAGKQPRQLVDARAAARHKPHPALTLWQLTGGAGTKTADDPLIEQHTVAAIAGLLAGEAVWDRPDDYGDSDVKPQHIAVLVNSNQQAANMQSALAAAGIAAVCQRRDSVFATDQASELALLLAAMAEPDNQTAVRSAETTLLAGAGLADVIALADQDAAMQACISRYQAHFQTWRRRGVLAALEPVFVAAAPRILALADGERRMSNYLQLGERLAVAETESHGPSGLRHWLAREIQAAQEDGNGNGNDDSVLRLESDDALVRIATLHAAKGLEYPIVFMPFALYLGAPSKYRDPAKPPHVYHLPASEQPDQMRINITGNNEQGRQRAVLEAQSESLRLLYVGLTRAAAALFISWREPGDGNGRTPGNGCKGSALELLLGRQGPVSDAFQAIAAQQPDNIVIETVDADQDHPRIAAPTAASTDPLGHGRTDLPVARPRWASYSFSRLAHATPGNEHALLPESGAEDELVGANANTTQLQYADSVDANLLPLDRSLGGVRFGSAVHDLLEHHVGTTQTPPWPEPGETASEHAQQASRARLRQYGLIGDDDNDPRIRQTVELVARTLYTPLPEIGALAHIQPQHLRTEMGFMLRLGGNRLSTIIATLRRAGYLPAPLGGQPSQILYGLMQGFIDVVIEHDGRYYLLDYKTNRLGDTPNAYSPDALKTAIGQAHYDLQYLIYTVALHRHLKQSLNDYDPDHHLGSVQYLFVRAMDGQSGAGLFQDTVDPKLIETLDSLLDPPRSAA